MKDQRDEIQEQELDVAQLLGREETYAAATEGQAEGAGESAEASAVMSAEEEKRERERREAKAIIAKMSDEEDSEISLKSIFGGEFLQSRFFINQILFVVVIVILAIVYTGNRYAAQQDTILIDSLRHKLQDVKYNVMTQSSVLMNMTRQSNVEQGLKATKDSMLQAPLTHPYLIKVNKKEEESSIE